MKTKADATPQQSGLTLPEGQQEDLLVRQSNGRHLAHESDAKVIERSLFQHRVGYANYRF